MLKWKESAALIVGVVMAAGAAAMPLPAEKGAVMTVTGEASVTLPNDEAQITVSKEVQDRDAKRASDEVVKAGNAAAEAMKAFGDAVKVETLALSTNPVYSRAKEGETPEIGAWRSVERMRVTVKDAKRVPEVLAPTPFAETAPLMRACTALIVAALTPAARPLAPVLDALDPTRPGQDWGWWCGPEGDFTPEELQAILDCGAIPVSLGPLILRVETAALYGLANLGCRREGGGLGKGCGEPRRPGR